MKDKYQFVNFRFLLYFLVVLLRCSFLHPSILTTIMGLDGQTLLWLHECNLSEMSLRLNHWQVWVNKRNETSKLFSINELSMVCCLSPSHAFAHWVVFFQYVLVPDIDICEDHAISVPKLLLSFLLKPFIHWWPSI